MKKLGVIRSVINFYYEVLEKEQVIYAGVIRITNAR